MGSILIKNHQIVEKDIDTNITFENQKLLIPQNTVLKTPLKITLLEDNHEEIEILVGKNSEVKLIVEVTDHTKQHSDYKIKLTAEENTQVKYLLIAALESKQAIINHDFITERNANLELLAGLVSDVLTAKLNVLVSGEGSNVKIRAVAVSSDENHQVIDVYMTHKAPNTNGDMTNIGIAGKKGVVVLNGIEKIEKGMKNSNVYQTLKGIITSDEARIDVNPILLIDEYDLQGAGHAATVGRIEEESLYYLQSRGLTKQEAERLIINGLLNPLIEEIEDEELKERFIELVNVRI